MKTSTIVKLGSIAAATACIAVAGAQTTSGLSVRAGYFFPSNSQASNLGANWFGFGADLKLSTLSASVPVVGTQAYFGISADYYSHGSDNDLPVALTYNIRQSGFVFSAGIGPDFRNASDLTDAGVGIGEQISVAYDIFPGPIPLFLQGKYYFSSKPELSGFALYLGARF